MAEINCYVPIKLRLVGRLSDDQLERMAGQLVQSVSRRLAAAETALASGHAGLERAGIVELREAFDPAREDEATGQYSLPSYDDGGASTRVPVRRVSRGRPWIIRKAINFHAYVGAYLDFIEELNPRRSIPATAAYFDLFETLRWVSLWLVQVNQPYLFHELEDILFQRAAELSRLRGNQVLAYGLSTSESVRQQLIAIDQDQVVGREISDMSGNERYVETVSRNLGERLTGGGETRLRPGARLLFCSMVLPAMELADFAQEGTEIVVAVRLRDLAFLVPPALFERRHGISWATYIQEFGDEPAFVRLLPFTVSKPIHFIALEYLAERRVGSLLSSAGLLGPDSAWYGSLFVLNNSKLQTMPPAVRQYADGVSNDVTRRLNETEAWSLARDWKIAYLSTVLTIDVEHIHAARYRPSARRLAVELIAKLQGDPDDRGWDWDVLHFLQDHYGAYPMETREPGGPAFEYLLEELERRGWFEGLFEKVEDSEDFELLQLLVRHALATRYSTHARVRQSHQRLNARYIGAFEHTYRVQEQEIWLRHDSDKVVRCDRSGGQQVRTDSVVAEAYSLYSLERDEKRLKESSIPKVRRALEQEAQALLGRILRGEEQREFSGEDFARAALAGVLERAQQYDISNADFEEVTVERSVRLLSIEARMEQALQNIYVTYEFVERVNGGRWVPVPETRRTQFIGGRALGEGFEQMLWFWAFHKTSAIVIAFAEGVAALAVIAVAWEFGVIGGAIRLAGGATAVVASITIAELFYFYRVIFRGEEFTWSGFFLTALDGYLVALAFRGGSVLGRALAVRIGTASVRQLVGGWILERVTVGVIGGAGSAALITFSHDLIRVVSGQGGWSSMREYIRQMAWGALLGTVFEFGIGALQPILRVGGASGLETLAQVVTRVREAGISPARWTALTAEALSNMRGRLGEVLTAARAGELARWFGERLSQVTEQLGQTYRLAVFRRVLELSPESLTRQSVGGLEKFLSLSRGDLTNEAALAILNRLNPTALRSFLETLNTLDDRLVRELSAAGKLGSLADAPQIAHSLAERLRAEGNEIIVNIGGAGARHEPANAINLNPNIVAPRSGIPNHVEAPGEAIGSIFSAGTVDRVVGFGLPHGTLNWQQIAPGSYRVLRPGGRLEIALRWSHPREAATMARALESAGFVDIQVISDALVQAVKP